MNGAKLYHTYQSKLLDETKSLYNSLLKGNKAKVPKTLNKLSKELVAKFPKSFLFKVIEIKSYEDVAEDELDNCFPGNFFPNENDAFRGIIYKFIYDNIKKYEDNPQIVEGIKNIINSLENNSLLKKYIVLIDLITKNCDEEMKVLCELLVSNPYKYKELVYLVDSNLNISPLPKKAEDFYAIKNFNENKIKFSNCFNEKSQIEKLREEFMNVIQKQNEKIEKQNEKIQKQDEKISDLNKEIIILKEDSKNTKEALFKIQIRDVIKAFINNLCWLIHLKKYSEPEEVKEALISISESQNEAINTIVDIYKKSLKLKTSGNNEGHKKKI